MPNSADSLSRHETKAGRFGPWKRLLFASILLAGSWIMAMLAAEIWIRATSPYVTPAILKGRSLRYDYARFSRRVFSREEHQLFLDREGTVPGARINSMGYRGPEFALQKPP